MGKQKLLKISKELGVPVKKLEDTLFVLKDGQAVDNNDLLRRVGVSKNALNRAKERLSDLLELVSNTTRLSKTGLSAVQEIVGSNYKTEAQIWDFLKDNDYKKVFKLLQRHADKRPTPDRKFDQFTATLETTALRVCLLNFLGDIKGKRLLFLGDDDFTSVGIASLRYADQIEVLDIDKRILENIKSVSETEAIILSTTKSDLRQGLPSQLMRRFDIVFTDPPYTVNGLKLFVSRAIQALDPDNHAARIYACFGNSDRAKERYLPIHQLFIDSGLMLKWIFDGFNRYLGAESIGSSSALFITDVTPKTKPLVKATYNEEIYTNN
jgi:predicted methyltransferase